MTRHTDIATAHVSREIVEPGPISGTIFREREKITVQLRLKDTTYPILPAMPPKHGTLRIEALLRLSPSSLLGESDKWA
jgi:hypothetical protein